MTACEAEVSFKQKKIRKMISENFHKEYDTRTCHSFVTQNTFRDIRKLKQICIPIEMEVGTAK